MLINRKLLLSKLPRSTLYLIYLPRIQIANCKYARTSIYDSSFSRVRLDFSDIFNLNKILNRKLNTKRRKSALLSKKKKKKKEFQPIIIMLHKKQVQWECHRETDLKCAKAILINFCNLFKFSIICEYFGTKMPNH